MTKPIQPPTEVTDSEGKPITRRNPDGTPDLRVPNPPRGPDWAPTFDQIHGRSPYPPEIQAKVCVPRPAITAFTKPQAKPAE
jgi:hypothetical protein